MTFYAWHQRLGIVPGTVWMKCTRYKFIEMYLVQQTTTYRLIFRAQPIPIDPSPK